SFRSESEPDTVLVIVVPEGTTTVAVVPSRCVTVIVLPLTLVTVPRTPPPPAPKARPAPLAPLAPAVPPVPPVPRARLLMAPAWLVVDGVFLRLAPAAAPARATTTTATMAIGSRTRKPLAGPELGQSSLLSSPAGAAEG